MKVPRVCGRTIALGQDCGRNLLRSHTVESGTQLQETIMRQVGILVAAALLAATVGACADPYYGYRTRTYAYTSDAYYPTYYSSRPVYYSSQPVYYSSPYYGSR